MPPQTASPTKTIEFEGTQHEFPADASDADVAKALKGFKPPTAATEQTSTGITVPAGSVGEDDTFLHAAGKRIWDAGKSVIDLAAPPATPVEKGAALMGVPPAAVRIPEGAYQTGKKAIGQAADQFQHGMKSAKVGEYGDAAGRFAQSGVTAASSLDPFASGSVTDINDLHAQGKYTEALGTGAADILMLWAGGLKGDKAPSMSKRVSGVTAAIGETGETVPHVKAFMDDMVETAKTNGQPVTIDDLQKNVVETKKRIDGEVGQALNPIRNQKVMPAVIERKIMDLITPDMKKTPEGRAQIQQIKKAAIPYQQPWTYGELDAKRMTNGSQLTSFYQKGLNPQISSLKSDLDMAITKAVRDGSAETVFRGIDQANPGMDTRNLKARHSAGIWIQGQMDEQIGKLNDKQAGREGRGLRDKIAVRGTLGESGPRAFLSGMKETIPGGGAKDAANRSVRRAFPGPTVVRKSVVLGMPIANLAAKRSSDKFPPPPEQ